MRIGSGYDVHRFTEGGPLVLGGVEIPFDRELEGHSDADVLLHAIADALLGAAALGDLGTLFPDTDERWENADSRELLGTVRDRVEDRGFLVGNVDATIVAERPRIGPHVEAMRSVIARILKVELDRVSVKATTSEGLGFVGREEGIVARASALLIER